MADNVVDILVKTTNEATTGFQSIVSDITGLSESAIGVLGGIGTAAVASALAFAGLGVAAVGIGSAFSQSYDQIRVGTGMTGSSLDYLKDQFKQVVSDVPTDFGSASTALTQLTDQLNLSGPPLTALSEQFLNLSRITGTDVSSNLKAGIDVFKNWNVAAEAQGSTLDMLFQATQESGIGFTQLAGELSTNGVKLRELGLDVTGATGFLTSLYQAGIDVNQVMPAMSREFANAAKGGKDAKTVLADFFHEVQQSPNSIKVGEDAVKLFGSRAGPQLVEAIKEGKVSLDALQGKIRDFGTDTINQAAHDTEHFGEKLTELKNRFLVLAEPISVASFDAVGNAISWIVDKGSQLGTILGPVVHSIGDAIATVAVPAWNMLKEAIGGIVSWLEDKVPTMVDKVGGAFQTLRGWLDPLITFIQSHQEVWERLGQALGVIAAIIAGALVGAVIAAAAVIAILVAAIVTIGVVIGAAIAVIYQIGQVLWDVFQNAKDAVATAGGAITSFFANLGQAFLTTVGAIANFFGNLVGWISTGLSAIGSFISNAVSFFARLPGEILSALAALPGLLLNLLANAFNGAMFAIGYAIGTIVKLVVGLGVGIVQALIALPGVLANIFTSAWNLATSIVSSLVSAVVSFFQQLPGRALGVLSAIWGVITTVFTTAKDNATNYVTTLVSDVVNFFQQLPGRAASALSSLWSAISGAFTAAWNGAVDKARDIEDSVGNFLSQIPDRARSALSGFAGAVRDGLSSAVGAAASIGSDIVHGVANGISSGVGFVIDAAKNAASHIIDGFKSALGIGSPSKVMAAEVGAWIPPGIGSGIADAAPKLQSTIHTVLGGLDYSAAFPGSPRRAAIDGAMTAAGVAANAMQVQLVVGGNADTALGRMLTNLQRAGQLQILSSAVVSG